MDSLRHDLAYGIRTLRAAPVFSLAAIATLALGTRLNTTIFTAVNSVFFTPLPVRNHQELRLVSWISARRTFGGRFLLQPMWDANVLNRQRVRRAGASHRRDRHLWNAGIRVARRTAEIGIRVSLGAPTYDVIRMVTRESLAPVGAGVVLGVAVAASAAKLAAAQLFGVAAADPLVMIAAVAVLLLTATLAAALPARHAARIDPMRALRYE